MEPARALPPDTQPRLGEKRSSEGKGAAQPPPIWFSAAGGPASSRTHEMPVWKGFRKGFLGQAPEPPPGPGVGILSSASPPLGLRSAMPPQLPPAPGTFLAASDPLTPHVSSSSSSLLHPLKPEPHHCCLLRPSRRHREFLPDSPGLHPALLAQAL